MKKMIVKGKQTLSGEVTVGGAKNSTVALIPAAILADTVVRFDSVPDILDVHNLMIILKSMNVSSHFGHGELMIDWFASSIKIICIVLMIQNLSLETSME